MSNLPGFHKWNSELKGIITIQRDEQGIAGINIPDCFSINNLVEDVGSQKATGRNLLMEYPHSNVLYKDSIYSLQSTGQTETLSILGMDLPMDVYTCVEYPDAIFLWNYQIGLFLQTVGTTPFLWKEDIFQFDYVVEGEVIHRDDGKLDGLLNCSQIQNPENLYPPSMINCFNNILAVPNQMTISTQSNMPQKILYNSFNNIQNEIWIDFHAVSGYLFNTLDITTCFGGDTHGYVIFSEEDLQTLFESNKITPIAEGVDTYSLSHNSKVLLSSHDKLTSEDIGGLL